MHFAKISVLATAGLVAANNVRDSNADTAEVIKAIHQAPPLITAVPRAPAAKRDLNDVVDSAKNIVDDASTWADGAKSKAESLASDASTWADGVASDASTWADGAKSKAESLASDAASHISTAVDGVETYLSTKAGAVETYLSTKGDAVETYYSTKAGAVETFVSTKAAAASSAVASASSAANNDNAAPSVRDSKAGVFAAVLALGATALGFMLV